MADYDGKTLPAEKRSIAARVRTAPFLKILAVTWVYLPKRRVMWASIYPLGNSSILCCKTQLLLLSHCGDGSPGHCHLCVGQGRHHWSL